MKHTLLFFVFLFALIEVSSQEKRSLTIDDLTKWNRIMEKEISDDGRFIAFKTEPSIGDPVITLYRSDGSEMRTFPNASGIAFTSDSRFMTFVIKAPLSTVKELKLKKTKQEDMPHDMLCIYDLESNNTDTIKNLKSYKLPSNYPGWIAYQTEPEKIRNEEKKRDDLKVPEEKSEGEKKIKDKNPSGKDGNTLIVRNLLTKATDSIKFVTEYMFVNDEPCLVYLSTSQNDSSGTGVYHSDLKKGETRLLYEGKAKIRQLTSDKHGGRVAFLVSADENDKAGNSFVLYLWDGGENALPVVSSGTEGMPEGWIINENARLTFGEKSHRLFFGTSPAFKLKDTTILDEDWPIVDVWHYSEGKLHTAQVVDKSQEEKRSYMAVYHQDEGKMIQLACPDMPDIRLINKGDASKVLALSNLPYQLESMWTGDPLKYDVWLIDIMTGETEKLKTGCRASVNSSPAGKYLYWYSNPDSSWYSYDIANKKEYRLTTPATLPCYNELNDMPNFASFYAPAGWLKDDEAFLISDRYDIWSVDPVDGRPYRNITVNGRTNSIKYRLLDFDSENNFIDPSVKQYLTGTNEVTRAGGYYSLDLMKKKAPEELYYALNNLSIPEKAKDSDVVIYTREDFSTFPDYYVSDLSFRKEKRLTDANPQQKDYLWGTAELVSWTSLDGKKLEGLLYKPENFDPSRKYPLIVNFYEKASQELYRHRIPEPGRSTIDYHYYTSNGYLVFNPDVYYSDGYPGQSAYNCVIPGIMSLIEKGFVDEKHIGAQGHSWGGYQVAYLATRTGLFAAIESGAPVVNMFSAYGGIRWGSGLNRSFQYEHTQSRIGGTIWDAPQRYWENSPLFAMDKVSTPILILANDHDDAVPWYQGIEFFIALRRLGKPAWLLNYNGEPHWPVKMANRIDFQKRMAQFFAHYLKDQPMPEWMNEGLPAAEKEFSLGY